MAESDDENDLVEGHGETVDQRETRVKTQNSKVEEEFMKHNGKVLKLMRNIMQTYIKLHTVIENISKPNDNMIFELNVTVPVLRTAFQNIHSTITNEEMRKLLVFQ